MILYGGTGQSWLAVNRGNRLTATGTATRPIIFTSRDNILGLNSDTSQGQWGGVVLMGRARTTDCTTGTVAGGTCIRPGEWPMRKKRAMRRLSASYAFTGKVS